jgi:hypothetical protein
VTVYGTEVWFNGKSGQLHIQGMDQAHKLSYPTFEVHKYTYKLSKTIWSTSDLQPYKFGPSEPSLTLIAYHVNFYSKKQDGHQPN